MNRGEYHHFDKAVFLDFSSTHVCSLASTNRIRRHILIFTLLLSRRQLSLLNVYPRTFDSELPDVASDPQNLLYFLLVAA